MRRIRAVKAVVSNIESETGKQTESDRETVDELCRYFSEGFVKEGSWEDSSNVKVGPANLFITVTGQAVLISLE